MDIRLASRMVARGGDIEGDPEMTTLTLSQAAQVSVEACENQNDNNDLRTKSKTSDDGSPDRNIEFIDTDTALCR